MESDQQAAGNVSSAGNGAEVRGESQKARFLREAFARWADGARDFYDVVLADDVRWTVRGTGAVAKTYTSKRDLMDQVAGRFYATLASPIRPTVRHILEDDTHVAVIWDGDAQYIDGRPYHNNYVWIFRMEGLKATEVEAYVDLTPWYELFGKEA